MVEFVRLIRRHSVLLTVVPAGIACIVILLTRKPDYQYQSQTVLYTGLATGSSVEMDKTFNYFVTNIAFENLISIVNSRETQQEVAIRLLSQHLLLPGPDAKYIAPKPYAELRKLVPAALLGYTEAIRRQFPVLKDTTGGGSGKIETGSTKQQAEVKIIPPAVHPSAYELTVRKLTEIMRSSDTNFVYKLLNYEHPHYSISAIASVKVQRIGTSDLIRISYETDDPGICQQTLAILNEVCIRNYRQIRENHSDEVVRYFEAQLNLANEQLKSAEDKLLAFNKSNNIINYYEQSKAVANVKEEMEVDYNNRRAELAGREAEIRKLEEKLNIQQLVQLKSNSVLEKKKQLGDINYDIAAAEAAATGNASNPVNLADLYRKAEALKADIRKSVNELYGYQHSVEGLPLQKTLSEWLNNVIEAENLKARIQVMDRRNREFQQQYSVYAPAGANIKRIEREIAVSEQGYLEILHGLNLAKLKVQDNELSSDLKALDPPYYPISAIPAKRKLKVLAAALAGELLVLVFILLMEHFDNTLRSVRKASRDTGLRPLGILSKEYLKPGIDQFPLVQKRLAELLLQQVQQALPDDTGTGPKSIFFLSTQAGEGKSTVAANIIKELKAQGKKFLMIDFSAAPSQQPIQTGNPFLYRMLGYGDPRINHRSPFLAHPAQFLPAGEYVQSKADAAYYSLSSVPDMLSLLGVDQAKEADYILVELPPLLNCNYPAPLLSSADLAVLVCRSNRIWSEADANAISSLRLLMPEKLRFVLNGAELQEVETMLGELPKKRSLLRKKIKSLLRFQFFSKNRF